MFQESEERTFFQLPTVLQRPVNEATLATIEVRRANESRHNYLSRDSRTTRQPSVRTDLIVA